MHRTHTPLTRQVYLLVMPDDSALSLTGFVATNVEPDALIVTDDWKAYAPLRGMRHRHRPQTQEWAAKLPPRAHRVFGNSRLGSGTRIMASVTITCRSTSTSLPSVSIGTAHRWSRSNLFLSLAAI